MSRVGGVVSLSLFILLKAQLGLIQFVISYLLKLECVKVLFLTPPFFLYHLLSVSGGFLAFEPPLLSSLGKDDCLPSFLGLVAMPLMIPVAYHDGMTAQVCDLAADLDWVSAKFL